jgi:hypothetical protein
MYDVKARASRSDTKTEVRMKLLAPPEMYCRLWNTMEVGICARHETDGDENRHTDYNTVLL